MAGLRVFTRYVWAGLAAASLLICACSTSRDERADSSRQAATTVDAAPPVPVAPCSVTVTNGYPTYWACDPNIADFVNCEIDDMQSLSVMHSVQAGLPASQITWWCQTQNADALSLNCIPSATNPCAMVHIYPGIMIYNVPAAIQTALSLNIVPAVETAPDGLPCPNGAWGDIGGVSDMDPLDGPVINWITNPFSDPQSYNAMTDGDFNNIASRDQYMRGKCTRPSTHTIFLAQINFLRAQMNAPESGCPTIDDPFALDVNGNTSLTLLNKFRAEFLCPPLPDLPSAVAQEKQACLAILADQVRILRDGRMGLFSPSFTYTQIQRQFAAFQGLQCLAQYGLTDYNPTYCAQTCVGQACGTNGCVGACGTCANPADLCSPAGQCASVCTPQCNGKQCGPDTCGGSCGTCTAGDSCDGAGLCQPVTSAPVSFAERVVPILNARCTGCHSRSQLDFDFTSNVAYANLVGTKSKSCNGRTFVVRGDSGDSYLMDKITGTFGLCAGESMRYQTTDSEVQTIRDWIDQGAINN